MLWSRRCKHFLANCMCILSTLLMPIFLALPPPRMRLINTLKALFVSTSLVLTCCCVALCFFAVTDHAIFMRQMAVGAESQNRYFRYSLHDPMRGIHSSDNEVLESTIVKASLFNAFLSQIVRSPVFGSGYSRRGHLGV